MSIIKAVRSQLGLSVTPANNFSLDASADNGTMKLARGNAGATTQDVMTVDATGKASFPQNIQTWQVMGGARVFWTTYTNDTGHDLMVRIRWSLPAVAGVLQCFTQGVTLTGASVATSASGVDIFTIAIGATYVISYGSGSGGTINWAEFR